MNSFHNPKDYYGLLSGEMGIPEALVSSAEMMMPPSTTTIKSVPTQSGNANSAGLQLFQIPTGAGQGYCKPGSLYLKCKITVTQTGAAGMSWQFGSGKGASAIISRLNVSCGGVMINSINNYHILHDSLLVHASSASYYENDSVLYEDVGVVHNNAANNAENKVVTVCIPILAPFFNNEQAVPLYLLNSPVVLEFLYNPVALAMQHGGANAVTEYTVSEAQIVYEQLSVSAEFEQSVKAKLASGSVYTTYLDDFYNLQVASSQTLNYQVGLGLSSVKAVLWTEQTTADQVVANVKSQIPNGLTNFRLFLDGRQINLHTLDTQATNYAEMQRALQNLWDYTCTSRNGGLPGAVDYNAVRGLYATENFLGGINCNRLSDGAFAFSGSPCQNINFILEHSGALTNNDQNNFPGNANFAAGVTYVMVLYSQKLMIDANGAITLVR